MQLYLLENKHGNFILSVFDVRSMIALLSSSILNYQVGFVEDACHWIGHMFEKRHTASKFVPQCQQGALTRFGSETTHFVLAEISHCPVHQDWCIQFSPARRAAVASQVSLSLFPLRYMSTSFDLSPQKPHFFLLPRVYAGHRSSPSWEMNSVGGWRHRIT